VLGVDGWAGTSACKCPYQLGGGGGTERGRAPPELFRGVARYVVSLLLPYGI
jgi:hypothetical protein